MKNLNVSTSSLNTSETSEVPIESGTKSDEGKSGSVLGDAMMDAPELAGREADTEVSLDNVRRDGDQFVRIFNLQRFCIFLTR